MFIGYQGNIANFIKNTREEFEAIPYTSFDKIVEVDFAEMFNGVIYANKDELFKAQSKLVEEARAGLYAAQVDPITAHINRLRDEELTPEIAAEIALLVEKRKLLVEEIKANNPYPTEPIEEIEELPVVEEAVVSEIENTVEEID